MADSTEFIALQTQLDNPTTQVTRSVFRDRHGGYAKEWPEVRDVLIVTDTDVFSITPEQFKSLTREQQTKVRNAPSVPQP